MISIEISCWLRKLSLLQYEGAFRSHGISVDRLERLSDADLLSIGVKSVVHRSRMLSAIKSQNAIEETDTNSEHIERRQLTIMFCDLVDSSTLARMLDPEDFRDVIRAYQQAVVEVVFRYDGHVAQYLGDGLMVYFGYPIAHEDDAIRAAHTAVELPAAIANLNNHVGQRHGVKLSLRTGISTGNVVVGHIGAKESGDILASGSTPNEAAHCQQLARPNSNVISQRTREIIGDRFKCINLPIESSESTLKQKKTAQQLFTIVDINVSESRFSAVTGLNTVAMVGRNQQLEQLRKLWNAANCTQSCSVLVRGEAGIGKSRLIQALTDDISDQEYYRIVYQCSPHHIDTPLHPAIQHIAYLANITLSDTSLSRSTRLGTLLENRCSNLEKSMNYLAPLFGIDADNKIQDDLQSLSAQEIRDETMNILLNVLTTLADDLPILFILEDAHWVDATTQTLLKLACNEINDRKFLVVYTARPQYDPSNSTASLDTIIDLEKLQPDAIRLIVHQLSKQKKLPASILDQIIKRTDGIPLFVEELTKMLLESNFLEETSDTYTLNSPISDAQIPSTLHASLIARLDQMKPVKEIAQVAACIGREFELSDIAAISKHSTKYIENSLSLLIDAQIISNNDRSIDKRFSFKHMLVRDAAYASLPKSRKRAIHQQLYHHYRDQHRKPELLAIHANEAGEPLEAIENWDYASARALERAAFSEAIAHLQNAIKCAHALPDTVETCTRELDLLVRQSHASTALKGFAHPHTVAINAKARALLHRVKTSPLRFPVLYGHWVIQHAVGHHKDALEDGNEMLEEAKADNGRIKDIIAHRVLGSTQIMMGNFNTALSNLNHALSRYNTEKDDSLASQYNLDPSVSARIYASLCCICTGHGDAAARFTDGLEQFAKNMGHQHTIIYAYSHLSLTAQVARWSCREHYIEQTNDIVERYDLMAYRGHAMGIKAMMQYDKGELSASLQTMSTALDVISNTKTFIYTPLLYATYAACLADAGEINASEKAIANAFSMSEANSEYWAKAEILRLAAHCAKAGEKDIDVIEAYLLKAIDVAENQGAKMWALRSETSLAKLGQETGKNREAKKRLKAMMHHFPKDGYSLPDWQYAECTLEQLGTK